MAEPMSRSSRSRRREVIQVRRAFAEPIGAPETLARYTLQLVEALCKALGGKGLGGPYPRSSVLPRR